MLFPSKRRPVRKHLLGHPQGVELNIYIYIYIIYVYVYKYMSICIYIFIFIYTHICIYAVSTQTWNSTVQQILNLEPNPLTYSVLVEVWVKTAIYIHIHA